MLIFKEKTNKIIAFVFIVFFCVGFLVKVPIITAQDPCSTDSDGDGMVDAVDATNNTTGQPNQNIINCNELPNTQHDSATNYTLLEPIGDLSKFDATQSCPLVDYINKFLKIFLGICAGLAMVMIVIGGLQYMTSELLSSKEEGVKNIQGAAFGFIMALAAYAFLNTINPDLLNFCPHIPDAIIVGEESSEPFQALGGGSLQSLGIYCPGSGGQKELQKIAASFAGKVVYDSKNGRNTIDGNKIRLDCSAFVKQVWQCAGMDFSGDRTATMFANQSKNNLTADGPNGKYRMGDYELKTGDLLGWMAGEDKKFKIGHVVMYVENGQFIEVNGSGWNAGRVTHYAGSLIHLIKTY